MATSRKKRPIRRVERIPSGATRRRRGPSPPDALVASLVTAVIAWEDEPDREKHREWLWILATMWLSLERHARRGVIGALSGTSAERKARKAERLSQPVAWAESINEVTDRSPELGGAALVAALSALLFAEHTRLVRLYATKAGARRYIWTTMQDNRVRDLHRKLHNTVQRWDRPPLAGHPDFHGHPGEAAGPCRCQAYPII